MQRKNHTFVWRICNVQITNTLRTFREHPTNTHEITHEHSAKYTHSPTKHPRITPPGVGDRFIVPVSLYYQIHIFVSPNTHFRFIIHEYSHYQICVSIPHFVGVYVYAGTINLPLQLLTDCDNVANIPRNAHENTRNTQRTPTKCPTKHTARRRGRFIVPVSLHYQIYIFISPNTCFYIIKYAFPFLVLWVFTYMRAR